MKLYDGGRAPNPRRTRIFLAEKGIKLPIEPVDLGAMQHKSPAYAAVNPLMRVPALVLDDGETLIDSTEILDHLDQVVGPERALLPAAGKASPGRAQTRSPTSGASRR